MDCSDHMPDWSCEKMGFVLDVSHMRSCGWCLYILNLSHILQCDCGRCVKALDAG